MDNEYTLNIVEDCIKSQSPILDLGNCGLDDNSFKNNTELYRLLKKCQHIKVLNFSNRWYEYDFITLKNSKNGWRHYISNNTHFENNFLEIPEVISEIKNIQKLIFSNFRELFDISILSSLKNLKELYIASNGIFNIESLKNLNNLEILDLGSNHINDILPLENLNKLRIISLLNNNVSNIEPLSKLKHIFSLDLRSNSIPDIRPLLNLLNKGIQLEVKPVSTVDVGINIQGNPLHTPPIEIIQKGTEIVINYIKSVENNSAKPLNEVKVLLIGDGMSGKTSLVKAICNIPFDDKESQTHGIKIKSEKLNINSENLTVHFWDFGGQEIMHATHQFFLTRRSVYLLVLDGRKEEKPEYWLKHIQAFGGNSPVLVILNKIDENSSYDIDSKELKAKYPNIIGFYKVSCKDRKIGIETLKKTLFIELFNIDLRKTAFSPQWFAVKENLSALNKSFIGYNEYINLCNKNGVTDNKSIETLLSFFHDLGLIFHFPKLKHYDTQVLNPLWLTNAVYKIINSTLVANQFGEFDINQMPEIFAEEKYLPKDEEERIAFKNFIFPKEKYLFIAKVMEEFEICYSLEENKNHFIIPDLLPVTQMEHLETDNFPLHYVIEYKKFLPPSIFSRFIVQTNDKIKNNIRWRTGLQIQSIEIFGNSEALVKVDKEDKKIDIYVRGAKRRELLTYIRSVFQNLHQSYENLRNNTNVTESLVISTNPSVAVPYLQITKYVERNIKEYFDYQTEKFYDIYNLLGIIENPDYKLLKQENKVNIFISYSRTKSKFKDSFETAIHLLKEELIESWYDEQMNKGIEWEKEIDEKLENSKIVVCLLSKEYFSSKYCMYEIKKSIEMDKIIYPILINDCPWKDTPFAKINGHYRAIEPIPKAQRDKIWYEVYEGIKNLISK